MLLGCQTTHGPIRHLRMQSLRKQCLVPLHTTRETPQNPTASSTHACERFSSKEARSVYTRPVAKSEIARAWVPNKLSRL